MRLTIRTVAGLVAGALGVTIWAALSYASGWELGAFAWVIGLAVGVAIHFGGERKGEVVPGAIAAAITLLAIAAGKTASVMVREGPAPESEAGVLAAEEDLLSLEEPELIISYLADDVVLEQLTRGVEVEWPDGVNPYFVRAEADYPPEVWSVARARWESMDLAARQATIDRIRAESAPEEPAAVERTAWDRLRQGLGPVDLLFFALGLLTAFWVGRGRAF